MPAIDARPVEYVAIPRPSPEKFGDLLTAAHLLTERLWDQMGELRPDDATAVEEASMTATALATVADLAVSLQYAQPCPEPERFPLPPVVVLRDGSKVRTLTPAKKADAKKPTKAVAKPKTRKAFDFAALPPRVEAGC